MASRTQVMTATPEQVDQARRVLGPHAESRKTGLSDARIGARRIPPELVEVWEAVLHTLVHGGSFTLETMPELLTTTQAAKLLGESRPTLMKRLSRGELSSVMVGSHHRLKADDVLKLRKRRLNERRAEAVALLELEDELGL